MKIWSLFKHENLTTGTKYCREEEKLLLRSNFSSFALYFQYISNFRSQVTYSFLKCGYLIYFFLSSAIFGLRDDESRLYCILYNFRSPSQLDGEGEDNVQCTSIWQEVPDSILLHIFSFLDAHSLTIVSQTCKVHIPHYENTPIKIY